MTKLYGHGLVSWFKTTFRMISEIQKHGFVATAPLIKIYFLQHQRHCFSLC